jgi:hypothetical protein
VLLLVIFFVGTFSPIGNAALPEPVGQLETGPVRAADDRAPSMVPDAKRAARITIRACFSPTPAY